MEMFGKVTDLGKAEDARLTPASGDDWESRVGCWSAAPARSRLGCWRMENTTRAKTGMLSSYGLLQQGGQMRRASTVPQGLKRL